MRSVLERYGELKEAYGERQLRTRVSIVESAHRELLNNYPALYPSELEMEEKLDVVERIRRYELDSGDPVPDAKAYYYRAACTLSESLKTE